MNPCSLNDPSSCKGKVDKEDKKKIIWINNKVTEARVAQLASAANTIVLGTTPKVMSCPAIT